ncbi:MAG: hypothetical protein CME32_09245 [Gimesia sp.]|nr:hypothetical protein [Gimesia sp.]
MKRSAHNVKDVGKLRDALNRFGSPFHISVDGDDPKRLVHLTSGVEAPEDVAESLLSWHEQGEKAAAIFKKLMCGKDRGAPFSETMKKTDLKTFDSRRVRATSKSQREVIYLSAAASCFLRLVVLNGARKSGEKISVEELSKHELSPLPFSLCNPTGERHSTQKHKLLHKVLTPESIVDRIKTLSQGGKNALVVDLMKVVQACVTKKGSMVTFGDLVTKIVASVYRSARARGCTVVYFVGDVYGDGPTIKSSCQERRAGQRQPDKYGNLSMKHRLPSARELAQRFLRLSQNKKLLLNLLRDNFHDVVTSQERMGSQLDAYLMIEKEGWHRLSDGNGGLMRCPELNCGEFVEADQRILVAIRHFTRAVCPDGGNVIVLTEDTDVCVSVTSFFERLVSRAVHGLYVLRGGSKPNLYDIGKAVSLLDKNGEGFHKLVLAMHVLTGTSFSSHDDSQYDSHVDC